MPLFACTHSPPMSFFVNYLGHPFSPTLATSFLMVPKTAWESTLSFICIQLFWVTDNVFAINIFAIDNSYSLRIDHSFMTAII